MLLTTTSAAAVCTRSVTGAPLRTIFPSRSVCTRSTRP